MAPAPTISEQYMQTAASELAMTRSTLPEETSNSQFLCQEDHDDSFEDLEEDSTYLHTEEGQTITIDAEEEDVLREDRGKGSKAAPSGSRQKSTSNSTSSSVPSVVSKQSNNSLEANSNPASGQQDRNFYQRIIEKLRASSSSSSLTQTSVPAFEEEERRYVEKIKVLYGHFILNDGLLTRKNFETLRALLYVPRYGQELVNWGNDKYGTALTVTAALERMDFLWAEEVSWGQKCLQGSREFFCCFCTQAE